MGFNDIALENEVPIYGEKTTCSIPWIKKRNLKQGRREWQKFINVLDIQAVTFPETNLIVVIF